MPASTKLLWSLQGNFCAMARFAPWLMPVMARQELLEARRVGVEGREDGCPPPFASFWGSPVRKAAVSEPQKG